MIPTESINRTKAEFFLKWTFYMIKIKCNIVGWRVALKDIRSKSLEPIHLTLLRKEVFADVIQLKVLRWDDPGLTQWALNAITAILIRGRQRELWHRQKRRGKGHHRGRDRSAGTYWKLEEVSTSRPCPAPAPLHPQSGLLNWERRNFFCLSH